MQSLPLPSSPLFSPFPFHLPSSSPFHFSPLFPLSISSPLFSFSLSPPLLLLFNFLLSPPLSTMTCWRRNRMSRTTSLRLENSSQSRTRRRTSHYREPMGGLTRSVYGPTCHVNLPLILCSLLSPSFHSPVSLFLFSTLFLLSSFLFGSSPFPLFSPPFFLCSPPLSLPPFLPHLQDFVSLTYRTLFLPHPTGLCSSLTYRTLDLYSPCCCLLLVHASPLQRDSLSMTDWNVAFGGVWKVCSWDCGEDIQGLQVHMSLGQGPRPLLQGLPHCWMWIFSICSRAVQNCQQYNYIAAILDHECSS